MISPDIGIDKLREIKSQFTNFCKLHGDVTEADTRANIIDRILTEVLCWPRENITREEHVQRGYMDYCLTVQNRRYIAVEAKKEGKPFTFPHDSKHKSLKISGSLLTDMNIKEAVLQVRGYCDDNGIRYAVATNGYAWILFRAIREDVPWRKGYARVFPSLEYILTHFTDFWRLLSYEGISSLYLDSEFGSSLRAERDLFRVADKLFNDNLPLERNRLHARLYNITRVIFDDIADQEDTDILQNCYVYSKSLEIVAKDLDVIIKDSIPKLLKTHGAEELIVNGRYSAGKFGPAVSDSIGHRKGRLFLLLGGIGSGKTTFLKRYQKTVAKQLLQKNTVWFHIDFKDAPLTDLSMEEFVWTIMLEQTRSRFAEMNLEDRQNIKGAFADKIKVLKETILKPFDKDSTRFNELLSQHLQEWTEDPKEYTPRLLRQISGSLRRKIVLFIDNVDQLHADYQAKIFMLAQRITDMLNAVTIVSLREESYYATAVQKVFMAYANRKFHIASPRFRPLIGLRINFALKALTKSMDSYGLLPESGTAHERKDLGDFLKIVQRSIFGINKNITRFIDAICYGDMRLALEMFRIFLSSGAADVDKMLRIYRRDGDYFVAFHEWVKSIMLRDRQYYKESQSPILNVFDCGTEKNSSHFTSLRILRLLLAHRGESSREGQGYFETAKTATIFEDVFNNIEDFIRSANKLVDRQLIEVNTKSTETIAGASHMRITSAGWYYYRFLVRSFCYLDLVLQDTPVSVESVRTDLARSVQQVNNLPDREEYKIERLTERFLRVETFLDYHEDEENQEINKYGLNVIDSIFREPFISNFKEQYSSEKQSILFRVKKNKEKYEEKALFELTDEEKVIFDKEKVIFDGEKRID